MSQSAQLTENAGRVTARLAGPEPDAPLLAAWRDLSDALVEENPFYEPWSLTPALAAYGAPGRVRLACAYDGARLIALVPVTPARGYAHLPLAHWRNWTHPHCYFGAPLVRRGHEEAALCALFALLCDGPDGRGFVRFDRIDRNGPLAAFAQAAAARERRLIYEAGRRARAVLHGGASADATLAAHLRKKKRKELTRLRRRLEELGSVAVHQYADGDDLAAWAQAFLTLEDRGWKGRAKSSLKAKPADANWFRATLAGATAAGKLNFMRIDLDGRPIAMLVNFLSAGAGYSVKICHDPEYARYSPGVMIEVEAMRALLGRDEFRFMDSCAAPDHSMINGLWRARRDITGINVSGRAGPARAGLRLCRALEGARARLPKGPPS